MTRPFARIGVVGVLVAVMSTALLFVFPTKAPGMPDGFATPIIAFEFAQCARDVQTLFGPAGSPEREAMVRSMDLGNLLDYVYMVLYSAFIALFSMKIAKRTGQKIYYVPAGLAALALMGDALENLRLFAIAGGLETMEIEADLAALNVLTWIKWGSLSMAFLFLAPYFLKGGKFAVTIGVICAFCPVLGVIAFFKSGAFCEMFSVSVALLFLLTIIYSLIYKEKRSLRDVMEATAGK
ncbi:hypothetical protein Dalk_2819 [Desulfatibacillum aliphaticivorans]|uniref:DUF4386 domain-containing protein n=1 Tax=Desulfatibacillum aliphaticivorans TaxID=218208 RepID=B8FB66_DESAL|nr:hypothetical protein [Desulfatibacillum aliphaticivorans]ACL04510.1 hypothetical protein Dalk_2819 [Desulfatibacillum aliphaticivorans]